MSLTQVQFITISCTTIWMSALGAIGLFFALESLVGVRMSYL